MWLGARTLNTFETMNHYPLLYDNGWGRMALVCKTLLYQELICQQLSIYNNSLFPSCYVFHLFAAQIYFIDIFDLCMVIQ